MSNCGSISALAFIVIERTAAVACDRIYSESVSKGGMVVHHARHLIRLQNVIQLSMGRFYKRSSKSFLNKKNFLKKFLAPATLVLDVRPGRFNCSTHQNRNFIAPPRLVFKSGEGVSYLCGNSTPATSAPAQNFTLNTANVMQTRNTRHLPSK